AGRPGQRCTGRRRPGPAAGCWVPPGTDGGGGDVSPPAGGQTVQQRLARWARSAPGYRWALTEVLPRVRSSATLSDLAWRVFAPRHTAGNVDVPLHGGVHLTGPDVSRVPVVGVVALGLDEEALAALMDGVARLQ